MERSSPRAPMRMRGWPRAARAEAKARAEAERTNEDVHPRARLQGAEIRKAQEVLKAIGAGISNMLSPEGAGQLARLCGAMMCIVAGGFAARETTRVVRTRVLAVLGRPRLVRETTRISPLTSPVDALRKTARRLFSSNSQRSIRAGFSDVILAPKLEQRGCHHECNIEHRKQSPVPTYAYGPPGTGKTLQLMAYTPDQIIVLCLGRRGPSRQRRCLSNSQSLWSKTSQRECSSLWTRPRPFWQHEVDRRCQKTHPTLSMLTFHTGTATSNFCIMLANLG